MSADITQIKHYHPGNSEGPTDLNLSNKERRIKDPDSCAEIYRRFVKEQTYIKAVTVCFSDIEGRLHTLDYDKNALLANEDNLTFDGSSIRGFTDQNESDLLLKIDWPAFYLMPPALVGEGKVYVFGSVCDRDGKPYPSDIRWQLMNFLSLGNDRCYAAAEIEGFLFKGLDAESRYVETRQLEFVTQSGYYNTLPQSHLRRFIDQVARIQRSLGFENEKDHGEVGCSQFEVNWKYTEASIAADQIQLYKLICRQIAAQMGFTASFLPKPVVGVNGNGMHINLSVFNKDDKNLFAGRDGRLSDMADLFIERILRRANELCLVMNSSVNSYRRLDPDYEAPNKINVSQVDRGAMIRIPHASGKSSRIEVRSISPDANPYLLLFSLFTTGLVDTGTEEVQHGDNLPSNMGEAIAYFCDSTYIPKLMGSTVARKYADWKQQSADRCPRILGSKIKTAEIMFHHEVTNQYLWQSF